MHGTRQPRHLMTSLEADGERLFSRLCGPVCRFHGGIDLRQRETGMLEKCLTCSGQLDAMNTTRQQVSPDLVLQVAHLPAEGWLGGV